MFGSAVAGGIIGALIVYLISAMNTVKKGNSGDLTKDINKIKSDINIINIKLKNVRDHVYCNHSAIAGGIK